MPRQTLGLFNWLLVTCLIFAFTGCDQDNPEVAQKQFLSTIVGRGRFVAPDQPAYEWRLLYSSAKQVVSAIHKAPAPQKNNAGVWTISESTLNFQYTSDGTLTRMFNGAYNADFIYDDQKLLVEIRHTNNQVLTSKVKFKYNEHGQLDTREAYTYDTWSEELTWKSTFTYATIKDKDPNVEFLYVFPKASLPTFKIEYEYDEKSTPFTSLETEISPIDFTHSPSHNIVKRTKTAINTGELAEVTHWEISYNDKGYPVSIQEVIDFPYQYTFDPAHYTYN